MRLKAFVLFYLILIVSFDMMAQEGPFLRFSLGPGIMKEFNTIHESGLTIIAKNHAVGWGFADKYAVSYSEFGGLIKKEIGGTYRYINLDAYGIGLAYRTTNHVGFHLSGAYGTVHFSDTWKRQGDYMEDGYAVGLGSNKQWLLSKRIGLGAGPHVFYLKTNNYVFTNVSFNFWLEFYLFPQRQL